MVPQEAQNPKPTLHLPRSLARVLRKNIFTVTKDRAFRQVIEACAAPAPGRATTWITSEFIEAYTLLHHCGHAHSLECWRGEQLVGGIYGVSMGGFFAGESMFHRVPNASKVALWHLLHHLRAESFALFDIQMLTPVTAQLGAIQIPRLQYLRLLSSALEKNCSF